MSNLQLKRQEGVYNPSDPFGDDVLGRTQFANALKDLVSDAKEPLVIALNGGWGTGKTFFLDRWVEFLRSNSIEGKELPYAISYNAWQDDDLDDPLLALVGQLHHYLHSKARDKDSPVKESLKSKMDAAYETGKKVAAKVSKHLGGVVEHYTGLNPDALVRDFANFQAQRVEDYSSAIKSRIDLKNRIGNLAKAVWDATSHPFVVVIDDLDRCRPSFAVSLMERIKHLFNVPYMVFILGIDLRQFECSLRNVYGADFDADNYLHRLIDLELMLPSPSYNMFLSMLMDQYHILEYHGRILGNDALDNRAVAAEVKSVIVYLAERYQMSLRAVERVVRDFVLIERIHLIKAAVDTTLVVLMVALRVCDPKLYHDFVNASQHPNKILDGIFKPSSDAWAKVGEVERHIAVVVHSGYKNTAYVKAIYEIGQQIKFKHDEAAAANVAEKVSAVYLAHSDVENVAHALQCLKDWKDREW